MNLFRFIARDFVHYTKSFAAVAAGTAIGAAVLTGALVLGDSVRQSLKDITFERLGGTRYALSSGNVYFGKELASRISRDAKCLATAALITEGVASRPEENRQLGGVQVVGIERKFCNFWENPSVPPDAESAVISANLATRLGLQKGGDLVLKIPLGGMAPYSAPFVSASQPWVSKRLRIRAIAPDNAMGRFSLKTNQAAPYNVFVDLGTLSSMLDLRGRANLILMAKPGWGRPQDPDQILKRVWQPGDASLFVRPLQESGGKQAGKPLQNPIRARLGYEIHSGKIFMDSVTSAAVRSSIPNCSEQFTWLVNSFVLKGRETPYSFVTAATPDFIGADPGAGGILINTWLAADLKAGAGDTITLNYFVLGQRNHLRKDSACFVVRGIMPFDSPPWDPDLMPAFPGIKNAGNCRDWETGTTVDLKKIRPADELYWQKYRGTPKAFIRLEDGKRIWNNPFGTATSFRFNATQKELPQYGHSILSRLEPPALGLKFAPVLTLGLDSASQSTDFGGLFLGLSFFIILASILLSAVLYSLHLQTREKEKKLLLSLGLRKRFIMWLYASECLLVAIAGSIVGSAGGVLYTRMMLAGLNTIWNDAAGVTGLRLAVNPLTVLEGAFLSVLVVTLVLLITLAGTNRKRRRGSAKKIRPIHAGLPALILTLGGAGLMIAGIPGIIPASISLLSGALILGGGSLAYYAWLVRAGTDAHSGAFSTAVLVLKNLSLRKRRTMSVFILLSLGTFSIFVTEGNRKDFSGGLSDPKSGAGGFTFWAETSIPLRYDPLSPEGSSEYGLEKDRLAGSMVYCMQRLQGEDASCLNLNRALNPAILGVPSEAFSGIGAFTFISATGDKVKRDPWRALSEPCGPRVIPAVADQNVILWSLGKKTGDTLFYRDDKGERIGLRLIAGLDNSIFQGYLLISDSLFRHHFPMNGGYRNFLVKCNPDNASETEDLLNRLFGDYGIKVTKANDRLASFHAVENTYLSVFALLGALGVLLGTLGMAAVILRNMFERKGELALYHAVGYGKKRIVMVIVSEHLLILLPAILLGAISSLSGLLPELLNGTSAGSSLLIFLPSASILILANGLFWSLVAAYRTVPAIFRELKENG